MKRTSAKTAQQHKTQIRYYLEQMLEHTRQSTKAACLFLPSIPNLSRQLGCSALEIQESMEELIGKGYQFLMISHDTPVTVCITTS